MNIFREQWDRTFEAEAELKTLLRLITHLEIRLVIYMLPFNFFFLFWGKDTNICRGKYINHRIVYRITIKQRVV